MAEEAIVSSIAAVAEKRSIEQIPLDERGGKPSALVGVWFGFNMVPLAAVVGSIGITLGLPLGWTVLALIIGNLLGGLTMGLHATQGPRLGVPQMLQARGQFGSQGASLLAAAVVIVGVGFFSSNIVVATQAIQLVFSGVSTLAAVTVSTLISLVIACIGYSLIRITSAVVAVTVGVVVLVLIALLMTGSGPDGSFATQPAFTAVAFFTTIAVGGSWQVGFAPFVSDYSRYMAPGDGERKAFLGTYFGATGGAMLMMIFGAYLASTTALGDPLGALNDGFGSLGAAILILFFVGTALANTLNSYTAGLCALTVIETFRPGPVTPRLKYSVFVAIHLVGFVVALAASGSFITNFLNFVTLVLYLLVPWSAINLVDYFLVRHGDYDVDSFFAPNGGVYGRWNMRAVTAYTVGIAAQVPFLITAFFTGFLVDSVHGVDIAWIVGFVVPGLVYAVISRNVRPAPTRRLSH